MFLDESVHFAKFKFLKISREWTRPLLQAPFQNHIDLTAKLAICLKWPKLYSLAKIAQMKDIAACLTGLQSTPPTWQRSQDRDFRSDHSLDIGVKTCSWVRKRYIITFKNLFKQLTRMGGKKAPFIILHKIGPLLVLHTGIGHGQSAALRVWSGFKESGAGNQKAIQGFNEDLSLWILVKVIAFHHRDMSLVFVQVTVDLGDQQLLGSQLLFPSGYQRHLKHNNKNKRTKNKM